MTFLRAFLTSLFILIILTGAFALGYWMHAQQSAAASFPILNEAYQVLTQNGLKDAPGAPALEYGMIRGMIQAYDDPHTAFIEPAQHELESNELEGKYGGIGAQIGKDEQGFWVLFPFPGSPADREGIQEGDRLLAVDGTQTGSETPADTIQAYLRGPVGKIVLLTVGRPPDYSPTEVTVKREEISIPSTSWHLHPGKPQVGIIDTNLIAASTPEEIQKAVSELKDRGATHFILDLRDNPGGLLTAGMDVARLFLREGIVLQQKYRDREVETYTVERPGALVDIPLIVLINHGSASAAEIIAGALKVHQRALLVGQPSFGKDSIQLVFELQDRSSLHVTAARWWIPGLEPALAGSGLQPDILVPSNDASPDTDAVLDAAIQALFGAE